MKSIFFVIIIATILFYGCSTSNKKSKSNKNELVYVSEPLTSGALSADFSLSGDAVKQELTSEIKLTNSADGSIEVQEIVIATDDGIRSLPTQGFMPFALGKGKDTSLTLKFNPTNDLKLYQMTGLPGNIRSVYTVSVSYKVAGNDNVLSLALKSRSKKNEFIAFNKKNKIPVTGYSFNTKAGFNEIQKKYLETLKQVAQPPFVYLSEQEIAISGLNFRLKTYYQKDTLHAELFIVNHADFPVKIIPDSLDLTSDEKSSLHHTKTITIEKISGSQQDLAMMEKGDRVLIHFKKRMELKIPEKTNLSFNIHRAFMLTGKKVLFDQNVQLLPKQF
ncbi:MAG: hypothetical protein JWR12_2930 [Mucilaginibacter sp.]|nr:hypothetical protein [Mucilaginibacter sp.]